MFGGLMAMHACQIGPADTALPCPGSPQQACVVTRGSLKYNNNNNSNVYILELGDKVSKCSRTKKDHKNRRCRVEDQKIKIWVRRAFSKRGEDKWSKHIEKWNTLKNKRKRGPQPAGETSS